MKFFRAVLFVISVVSSNAFPSGAANAILYNGYKVFRIRTQQQRALVLEKLSSLSLTQWNHDASRHLDIAVSPDQLNNFSALNLEYDTLHEDLGASIAAESATKLITGRQISNLSWFDSYHSYEEHEQYWKDLQAAFPNNSESISSGTSYEGRDIFGLHLWGSNGPGKPAVLWHGTVHAREWISSMVSLPKIVEYYMN